MLVMCLNTYIKVTLNLVVVGEAMKDNHVRTVVGMSLLAWEMCNKLVKITIFDGIEADGDGAAIKNHSLVFLSLSMMVQGPVMIVEVTEWNLMTQQ